MVASRLLKAPMVQYVYAKEFGAFARLSRAAVRRAAAVVAISSYTAGLAVTAGAPASRVHLVLAGVDLPPSPDPARDGRPTLVTVSRLDDRYKGHDVVLDAMPAIREAVPDVRWIVVGDGSLLPELRAQAATRGLDDVVHFTGRVGDAERDEILGRAHVFVMPSRVPPGGAGGEGFGIALLEANAHGVPVVAGRAGGTFDAVADGRTALLVDPGSAAEVAQAVVALLGDEDRRRAFGDAAIAHSREFSWPQVGAQVSEIVRSVGTRPRR